MLFAGVIGIVIFAIVLGFFLSGDSEDYSEDIEVASVTLSGWPLPVFQGSPDQAIGARAPAISTKTTLDETVKLNPADGIARVIGFFAHWCPHCQREIPRITAWLDEKNLPNRVEVIIISSAVDSTAPNYPPSAWLRREGWQGPILVDNAATDIATGYGLSGFPYWVVLGGEGKVITRTHGALSDAEFSSLVDQALQSLTNNTANR